MPRKWEQWFSTLVGGAISGGANAALASFGPGAFNAAASTVGANVSVKGFDHTQVLSMFCLRRYRRGAYVPGQIPYPSPFGWHPPFLRTSRAPSLPAHSVN